MSDGPTVGSALRCDRPKKIVAAAEPKTQPCAQSNPNVGASLIVQPPSTYTNEKNQNDCETSEDPIVGAVNMANLRRFGTPSSSARSFVPKEPKMLPITKPEVATPPTITPLPPAFLALLKLIALQMARPLFGIPETLQHIAATPYIKEIVGAPAMALKSMSIGSSKPDKVSLKSISILIKMNLILKNDLNKYNCYS